MTRKNGERLWIRQSRRASLSIVEIIVIVPRRRCRRGVPPGDLPIEPLTHFEFVLNLKIATQLGVRLESATLIRADEVIE